MPRRKISAANTESPEVASNTPANIYYEYITTYGISVLLTRYEWSRGLGLSDKNVKKAQAARHREVANGLAEKLPA